MYELLAAGLVNIAQVKYLLPLFFGTLAGVVGGALPGVTITMTIIVVLPFTFGLDPLQGLAAMTGVYVGGSAGGLVTAVLLGIPGTPAAIATVFDGHPMAKKGGPRNLARRLGVVLRRSPRRRVSDRRHRTARGDRASIRAVGVLFAVHSRRVDGCGADRGIPAEGVDRRRPRSDRHRAGQRPGDGPGAADARHRLRKRRHRLPSGADRGVRLCADHGRDRAQRR